MLEVTRIYLNASDEELRIDRIFLVRKTHHIVTGKDASTYVRQIKTTFLHGPVSRDVATINTIGNYSAVEDSSGNYLWATWEKPVARVSMNDLPKVNDTV